MEYKDWNEIRKCYKENHTKKVYKPRIEIYSEEDGIIVAEQMKTLDRWIRHYKNQIVLRKAEDKINKRYNQVK